LRVQIDDDATSGKRIVMHQTGIKCSSQVKFIHYETLR